MKKNLLQSITKINYVIFLLSTLVTMFIVYKNIKSELSIKFAFAYLIYTFLFIFYIVIVTILNGRKLKKVYIKDKMLKFILYTALFSFFNYIFDYFFRPEKLDFLRSFSNAIGLSFGIYFTDVIFLKNKRFKKYI